MKKSVLNPLIFVFSTLLLGLTLFTFDSSAKTMDERRSEALQKRLEASERAAAEKQAAERAAAEKQAAERAAAEKRAAKRAAAEKRAAKRAAAEKRAAERAAAEERAAERAAAEEQAAEEQAAERAAAEKQAAERAAAEEEARREKALAFFLNGQPTRFSGSSNQQTIKSIDFTLTYSQSSVTLSNVSFQLDPGSTDFKDHIEAIRQGKNFELYIKIDQKKTKQETIVTGICCWHDNNLDHAIKGGSFVSSDRTATISLPFVITAQDIKTNAILVWLYIIPEGFHSGSGGAHDLWQDMQY